LRKNRLEDPICFSKSKWFTILLGWAKLWVPFFFAILLFTFPTNPDLFSTSAEILDEPQTIDSEKLANVKIPFIENQGQVNSDEVKYYAKTFAGTAYVTNDGLTYSISGIENDNSMGVVIKEKFLDSNGIIPKGIDKSVTVVSYFKGEQENWRSNIPTYNSVDLGEVWDSVDVELKAYGANVEKLFLVNPGGYVHDIKLGYEGVTSLAISDDDELLLQTEAGTISMTAPIAYQYVDGIKKDVTVSYTIDGTTFGFIVGNYNKDYQLIIDPLLASTFIGGSGEDAVVGMAIDGSGRVYVTGLTDDDTTDYPTTTGAFDETHNGGPLGIEVDIFVSRLDADLTTLQASTFFGSGFSDLPNQGGGDKVKAIAIDGSGRVYITGWTDGFEFPTTTGAFDESPNDFVDVFVSRFNADLTTLQASTFIAGDGGDTAWAIAIDGSDRVYVAGSTSVTAFAFRC